MSETAHIIVIEDDDGNRRSLVRALSREGYRVEAFPRAEPALGHLRENRDVALVVTDLMLPGTDGFGVLARAREIQPSVGLLMVTGHATVESAVDAMKRGADDYLTKPVNLDELRTRVANIIQKHRDRDRREELENRLYGKYVKMIGESKPMQDLRRQMSLVANSRANVLIVGESGTGKELVANYLHEDSPRHSGRFLPINCAAIPAEILESELFGHERGSFTGATGRKIGKFELAHGGTLFLDEVGELPLEMQVKLLRVLEQREFMRVGGTETIKVDIRLIAATNQDLESAVENRQFRSDLYYRLKVVTLHIPPLREREGDVQLLANHFLREFAEENGRPGMHFSPGALAALVAAEWEGNVRELRNVVESVVVLAPHDEVRLEDIPDLHRGESAAAPPMPLTGGRSPRTEEKITAGGDLTMEEIERRAILAALDRTGGNRTQAAELLGIGLRTLQRKIKEYRMAGKAGGH